MATPYEREFYEAWTAGEVKALDFPGRCEITKIAIVRIGTGAIAADIYNRLFEGPTHDVFEIVDDGSGNVQINLAAGAADLDDVKVGDVLEVAGSSVGGYNVATHRITSIAEDLRSVVTSESFTSVGTGGTVKLNIPTAEQPAYQVMPQITGTDSVLTIPPGTGDRVIYVNQDPLPNVNIGVNRKLYLKMADAGTYRVLVSAGLSVAGEG